MAMLGHEPRRKERIADVDISATVELFLGRRGPSRARTVA